MTLKHFGLITFYLGLALLMAYFAYDMRTDTENVQAAAAIEECEATNKIHTSNNREREARREYLLTYAHLLTVRAKADAAAGDKNLARLDLQLARNAMDWHSKIVDSQLADCERLYHGG